MTTYAVPFIDRYHGEIRIRHISAVIERGSLEGKLLRNVMLPESADWHTQLAEFSAQVEDRAAPIPTYQVFRYRRETYAALVRMVTELKAPVYVEENIALPELDEVLSQAQRDQLTGWAVRFANMPTGTKGTWSARVYEIHVWVARLQTWLPESMTWDR